MMIIIPPLPGPPRRGDVWRAVLFAVLGVLGALGLATLLWWLDVVLDAW